MTWQKTDVLFTELTDALTASREEVDRLTRALKTINSVVDWQTGRVTAHRLWRSTEKDRNDWLPYPSKIHPLVCGNNSEHRPLYPYWTGKTVVLRCADCDYEQPKHGTPIK